MYVLISKNAETIFEGFLDLLGAHRFILNIYFSWKIWNKSLVIKLIWKMESTNHMYKKMKM